MTAHTQSPSKPVAMKSHNGPHASAKEAEALAIAIDQLILARIEHARGPGTGAEAAMARLAAVVEELKKAL